MDNINILIQKDKSPALSRCGLLNYFDYLNNSSFFHQNMDKLFKIENNRGDIFSGNSRNRRKKIKITDEKPSIECEEMSDDLFGDIFKTQNKENYIDIL